MGVCVGVDVLVAVRVGVGVSVGVDVCVGVRVNVAVGVDVRVGVDVEKSKAAIGGSAMMVATQATIVAMAARRPNPIDFSTANNVRKLSITNLASFANIDSISRGGC